MGHVTDGVLRRYLDEPAAVGDDDRHHLATCARCGPVLQAVAADRDAVRAALDGDGVLEPDVDAAWARLGARRAQGDDVQRPVAARAARAARATRATRPTKPRRYQVVAGVTAGLLVIGGTAAAAAADWLPIFRTESVTPVSISMTDVTSLSSLAGLRALADYGDLTVPSGVEPTRVADAAEARARTGLDVPRLAQRPAGVTGDPEYLVAGQQTATFTFSAADAQRAAKAGGTVLPPVPDGLDGSTLKVDAGPAVAQVWSRPSGPPTLLVVRLNPPAASSRGASLDEVRDYLLSIPGIPRDLAAQLRTVTDDGRTLPIPVLAGEVDSSTATVDGVSATVLESRGGFGAGVVWVADGAVTVVAGSLDTDEILAAARGLR